jgi:hypothetical protein
MRNELWLGSSLVLLCLVACATGGPPPRPAITVPTVPPEIQAPSDTVPVAKLAARGTQNYRCDPTPTGSDWKLVAPAADLTDPSDPGATLVVKHGAGPRGTTQTGVGWSATAERQEAASDGVSIPWLLIPATANGKPRAFRTWCSSSASRPKGGAAPVGGCTLGQEVRSTTHRDLTRYRKR